MMFANRLRRFANIMNDIMCPMDFVTGLNTQQQQAVMAGLGPVLVLAGPGSGKTRVLTQRIAYLIGALGVRPYQILAVTFTNKAAREMENRVTDLLGDQGRGVTLGTFHANCARILRREAEHLPFNANFVIFDDDDQVSLLKRVIAELNLDDKVYRPQAILNSISNAKNELVLPDDYPVATYRDEVVQRAYHLYQQFLLTNNALDFDDLLLYTATLLDQNPAVREKYARRYEHILVDEFQDTNMAQYMLLSHLASFHGNIFVVGDSDQSIYRWRGADYRNVLRFERDYPSTQVILLEQNYRSTQKILDTAMAIIDHNPQRTRKELFTRRGGGMKPILHEAYDDRQEAAFIVDTITGLVRRSAVQPGDFAVMYRTNAQSRLIEEALIHARLPYRLVGAQRFYGRREVKDMIAFLRLVENPGDEVSLLRVIGVPPRGIGEKTILSLQSASFHAGVNPGEVLLDLGHKGEDSAYWSAIGRSATLLADFGALLADWQALKEQNSLISVFDRIISDTGYEKYVNDQSDEGNDRWDNVLELRRLAYDYQEKGLTEFLQNLALVSDQDTLPVEGDQPSAQITQDAVTLLTLHSAKGLEFNQVFIIGLDEGLLPHSRSRDDPEEMAEERRLFYVGMTRARNQLYLVRSERRSNFGSWEYSEPSRFLEDISADLVISQGKRGGSRRDARLDDMRWTTTGISAARRAQKSTPAEIHETRYKPGMRIRSAMWGEGLILESKIDSDGEETVDVHFESVGFKRVLASLANLEILP